MKRPGGDAGPFPFPALRNADWARRTVAAANRHMA